MDELFRIPTLTGATDADGWTEEVAHYRISPRRKSTFKTVLDPKHVFGPDGGSFRVHTRARHAANETEDALHVSTVAALPGLNMEDRFVAIHEDGGLRAASLHRQIGAARSEQVDFLQSPFPLPRTSYPEVLLPFLMRGQPRDGKTRAAYSWTNDRFVARVYYERRGQCDLDLPAGKFRADEVWMYPDLNDWIALGGVLTKLAKPLLPRYNMWFEAAPTSRVLKFEGPFGPPGAPEIVIELASKPD